MQIGSSNKVCLAFQQVSDDLAFKAKSKAQRTPEMLVVAYFWLLFKMCCIICCNLFFSSFDYSGWKLLLQVTLTIEN